MSASRIRIGPAAARAAAAVSISVVVAFAPLHFERGAPLRPVPAAADESGAGAPDSAAVRVQVDAGNATFLKGWMTGDADLFASCFAADGAMLQPGGRAVLGREAIRARMKSLFERVRMTEGRIETVDLFILGDTAYETGKWWFTMSVGGAPAEADSGRFVEVWKREGETWRMWRDIGVPR